jgi:hypothetical protein
MHVLLTFFVSTISHPVAAEFSHFHLSLSCEYSNRHRERKGRTNKNTVIGYALLEAVHLESLSYYISIAVPNLHYNKQAQ